MAYTIVKPASSLFHLSPPFRTAPPLPPAKRWGGDERSSLLGVGGGGVPQQTRCQRSELIDPPPPTPPHHAQRRVEGGEITVHDFAISRRVAPEVCQKIPYPP